MRGTRPFPLWAPKPHYSPLVTFMVPIEPEIRYYVDRNDRAPFSAWFDVLDAPAAAKVVTALKRLALCNTSQVKSVGGGVCELRIDFGPGYRVYFGRDGQRLVILLAGGTKKRQQNDIDVAQRRWDRYLAERTK